MQYNNPCLAPSVFNAVQPDITTQTDTYSNTLKQWQLKEFEIEPDFCIVEYSCVDVTRDDGVAEQLSCTDFQFDSLFDGQQTDGKLQITIPESWYTLGFPNSFYAPGVYTIEIEGHAINAETETKASVFVTLELVDPCNPPQSITPPDSLEDRVYTPTTSYADFGPGTWSITPDYCPFDFEVTCTPIVPVNGNSDTAITYNDSTDLFSIDY